MFKHILATMTGLLLVGGTVSTAKAPPPKPIKAMQAVEYQLRETILVYHILHLYRSIL